MTNASAECSTEVAQAAEPFLRWAGGKRLLLQSILPKLPSFAAGGRYFEPFLGGGAVFFALRPAHASLSDLNEKLIQTYRSVRDEPDAVIEVLSGLENSRDQYYRIRGWAPRVPAKRAARFIYLNKTCFNGLYRENLAGEFNVPYGRQAYETLVCDREQLDAASEALQGASLRSIDFVAAVREARRGDFVYFDPPYITGHQNNGFVEYNARVFSWADQHRLRAAAGRLIGRGVSVAISNSSHSSIRRLYADEPGFRIHRLKRQSTMASRIDQRFETSELLIVGEGAA
jgi:DNA adenine methylase